MALRADQPNRLSVSRALVVQCQADTVVEQGHLAGQVERVVSDQATDFALLETRLAFMVQGLCLVCARTTDPREGENALPQLYKRERGETMQVRARLLACPILFALVAVATADPPVRDTALFVKNAFASHAPMGYWSGDAEHPPTFFFYMRHAPWQAGSDVLRRAGATLLGCVAPVLAARFELGPPSPPARNRSAYHYRIEVLAPPPGGPTTLAAESRVDKEGCEQSLEAQQQFLDGLFPQENHRSFSRPPKET